MNNKKPFDKQTAFTLVELIIILLILGIIASYIQPRSTSIASFKENTTVDQLISAARLAQQLSMNDSARSFILDIQSNQIDLKADGLSISVGNINFPIVLDSTITISPAVTIIFDSLGETSFQSINITAESTLQVCFESSGYIHQC